METTLACSWQTSGESKHRKGIAEKPHGSKKTIYEPIWLRVQTTG